MQTLRYKSNSLHLGYCNWKVDSYETIFILLFCSFSAPPTYTESVLGKVNVKEDDDNEHTRGNMEWAPAYTYYDWGFKPTTMEGFESKK